MPAVGRHEQPPIRQLALEAPRVIDRDERVAVAAHDHRRGVDPAQVAWRQQRLDGDIGGDGRQKAAPRVDALARVMATTELLDPCRLLAIRARGIHQPAGDRGTRLALGRDPGHGQRAQSVRAAHRVLKRRHRAHREADEVERLELDPVDEGGEVIDQPVVAEPVGRIPAGPTMAARVRQVEAKGSREERDLGREVAAPDRRRPVQEDEGWAGAVDVIGDVDAIGLDRRHPSRLLPPPAAKSTGDRREPPSILGGMTTLATLTSRAWAGPDDLRAMTAIVSAAWASPRRPLVSCTPGDLEWWTAQGGPDAAWPSRIRIWELGGEVVGWGWMNPPAGLDWFVVDGLTPADEDAVRDEMLAWLTDSARRAEATAPSSAEPAPIELEAWAADGWPEQAALVRRGWTPTATVLTQYVQSLDVRAGSAARPGRLRPAVVARTRGRGGSGRGPSGGLCAVEDDRREVRDRSTARPTTRFDRDIVLEAADGSFAAFAMCWVDPVGSIGEFEPVGVHPDHQRRGLGRVIMRHGLRLMRAAGLRDAMVFSLRSNAASEALYQSAGFHELALHRQYSRRLAP